jgi:hypothetical protein
MIRRSQSRSLSEDSLAAVLQAYKYYSAIFEFSQGSAPLTAFECGDCAFDTAGFRLWIVNTPAYVTSGWNSPPTVVRSSWGRLHYITYHIQIQDVQARGFTRAISFVVANPRPELITGTFTYRRKDFDAIAELLQKHAMRLFLTDIQGYTQSLDRLLQTVTDADNQRMLLAKSSELAGMMAAAGISKIDLGQDCVDRPIEYFTRIDNDLRPIGALIDLGAAGNVISSFIETLPTHPSHGKFATALWNCQSVYGKDFLTTIAIGINGSDSQPFPICPGMIHSRLFHSCLFSLFSGRTLVLNSGNQRKALNFAQRIAVVSPFTEPFSIADLDKPIGFEYLKYDIVVSHEIQSADVSVLNLDSLTFVGAQCPPESIVCQEFAKTGDEPEGRTLLIAANEAKRLFARFRWKLAEISVRGIQTEERIVRAMKSLRFAQCDLPICRYWMMRSPSQQQSAKPILIDSL